MSKNKLNQKRFLRSKRIRSKIRNSGKPRLSVFKSNKFIYVQVIDDSAGKTIASASSRDLKKKMKPMDSARELGAIIAKKLLEDKISEIVFDRGRYSYHGVVKALSEGARAGGLIF